MELMDKLRVGEYSAPVYQASHCWVDVTLKLCERMRWSGRVPG